MTTVEALLDPLKSIAPSVAQPQVGVILPRAVVPGTSEECRDVAKHLANSVVSGFVEHDKGCLDRATNAFFQVYLHLFPDISPLKAQRAAELYVKTCVLQDEIEDHPGHTREDIVADPRWEDVRSVFLELTKTLSIPDRYADETTDYFRFHGVRDPRYMGHCLEADKIFTTAIIGDDYWAKMLGHLYLICTECHDKHDLPGVKAGIEFAAKYFEIILRAKAMKRSGALVSMAA